MKNKLLIAGCGDIAMRLSALLWERYHLIGLCRNTGSFDKLRAHGISPIAGDLDHPASLGKLSGLAHTVVHLAPPPKQGRRDTRTKHLLAALCSRSKTKAGILPQQFIYISTSGVYGDCGGNWVNESHAVNPRNERAWRRLDAEQQVRNWGVRHSVRTSILRVPGIYADNRLPVKRLQQGLPALLSHEDSYTNHIHADDLARIIVAVLRYGKSGRIYHACDDSCLKMGDYFDLVADHFGLPRPRKITRQLAQTELSPEMLSFVQESRRLTNARIKQELQVQLCYPTVADCLATIAI
ncbi:MAG: SDR family oxidoreductase [Nitrosomonas sp.]|nr:SDR family oxidoreductase [Nitrosomonas sp.]